MITNTYIGIADCPDEGYFVEMFNTPEELYIWLKQMWVDGQGGNDVDKLYRLNVQLTEAWTSWVAWDHTSHVGYIGDSTSHNRLNWVRRTLE